MNFHAVRIYSELNPKQVLATYFATSNDNYRVQQSLTSKKWLAFFRTNPEDTNFSLVGPPTETKKAAIEQCCEHSLALPW